MSLAKGPNLTVIRGDWNVLNVKLTLLSGRVRNLDDQGVLSVDAVADFVGDSGSGGVHGLVPAPRAGDGAAAKVLVADGTWQPVGGLAGGVTKGSATLTFGTSSARRASASVTVGGQAGLSATSLIHAEEMTEASADHRADVPRVDPLDLNCEYVSATSFKIYGQARRGHTYGARTVRWWFAV